MTPMPTDEDIMFLGKYRPHVQAFCKYVQTYTTMLTHLMLWWFVVLSVCTALAFHYLCNVFHIFPVETHAIYVIVCQNMGALLEYFSNTDMCEDNVEHTQSHTQSRTRIIMDRANDKPYLLRYYLLIRNRMNFPFNVFIHKFMKGDEDDIHDHPWGFFHIILSGGYFEYITVNDDGETLDQGMKKVWRPPGHWNIVSTKYKHKVELGAEKPWTIFIPFGKRAVNEPWGFWEPPKNDSASSLWTKTDNKTYLANKAKKE